MDSVNINEVAPGEPGAPMCLPSVAELIAMARKGYAPETVFGPDRPRMAVRLFEARDQVTDAMTRIDWGSEIYARRKAARRVLDDALTGYAEYVDRAAALARC